MARWAYILTTFFALAAWAGAQGPVPAPPLSAADQLRLLKANGTLIDNLVHHGVGLSSADTVEKRAEQCRGAAKALADAAQDAASKQDTERVAELTSLFRDVFRDALLPTLQEGERTVTPESPAGRKLREVRDASAGDVTALKAAIPATGKVAENARVKKTLKELDTLAEKLK